MIEQSFYQILSSTAAITAIADGRIYPAMLPEDSTLPALVYRFITGINQPTMDTRGVQRSRVRLECFGYTYSEAVSLREAVQIALAGYRDENFAVQIIGPSDDFDHELLQFNASLDLYLTHSL